MLKLDNIEVMYFGTILVLKGVSIEVPDGGIITLLGANGAGKTTTLRAISGLLHTMEGEVTDGSITFNDRRIDKLRPNDIVKLGIVQILEAHRVLEHLTTEENLRVASHLRSDSARVRIDLDKVYEYFPALKGLRQATSGYLSGGEQQMLVIGRALMADPKVMLLDEPSLGLAPLLVQEIFRVVRDINSQEKTTILLVEQNVRAALSIASYGYVLENGRVVLDGPSEKLADNEDMKEFYLGLSAVGKKKSYREVKHYKRRKRWLG